MDETLNLSIDADQYAQIQQADAVVVGHYTGPHGRFARLQFIGTRQECEEFTGTPALLIVPRDVAYDGSVVVPVDELLPPIEQEAAERPR